MQLWEFLAVLMLLQGVVLMPGQQDTISWKWTATGTYVTRSAYKIQFQGATLPFHDTFFWKANVELKVRFFTWTALYGRLLTADNLELRVMDHGVVCAICHQQLETADHLLLYCPFAQHVISQVLFWQLSAITSLCLSLAPLQTECNATLGVVL